jgi:hypothetical protein
VAAFEILLPGIIEEIDDGVHIQKSWGKCFLASNKILFLLITSTSAPNVKIALFKCRASANESSLNLLINRECWLHAILKCNSPIS